MSLLGNGYRFLLNPSQISGAGSALATEYNFQRKDGVQKNWYIGQATVIGGVSIANKNGRPQGAGHPEAWVLAPKGTALAALNLIEGAGAITCDLTIATTPLDADLSGTSAFAADIVSPVGAAADIVGANTTAADLEGRVYLEASIASSSTFSNTTTQLTSIAADLSSSGGLLDTSNVGAAVLAAIVEAGYTLKDVLRLMAAESVGEVSGGPDNPEFVGLDGTTVRVTATADPDGNRSGMVLVPG
jgi:hypothetical protein